MSASMPAYVIEYLAKAMAWAKQAPETPSEGGGVHFYLTKIAVICEGEFIGYLVNEDPEWIFEPGDTQ